MKNFFLVSAVLALTALALFGCVQKTPQSPQTTAAAATTTATAGATTGVEVDSLLDSFDASLSEASSADSELSTLPNEFDASLLNES